MIRAVIASILAIALLCLPAGMRHELMCHHDGLGSQSGIAHSHSNCGHHHDDSPQPQEDCQNDHQHSGHCLDVAKAGVGLGALALSGIAVVTTDQPQVMPALAAVIAPEPALDSVSPFRPPPGRTRLSQLSSFRL